VILVVQVKFGQVAGFPPLVQVAVKGTGVPAGTLMEAGKRVQESEGGALMVTLPIAIILLHGTWEPVQSGCEVT